MHDEGDFVIAVALIHQERNTCECRDVVLYRTKCMVQAAGNFIGLQPLEVEAHGVDTVSLAPGQYPAAGHGWELRRLAGGGH